MMEHTFRVHEGYCGLKKAKVSHKSKVLGMTRPELAAGSADRIYPKATIDALPDNVFLETFEFYLGEENAKIFDRGHHYDAWQTLVHVCHRWRSIVFASPRRLDLKLYCTEKRLAKSETLEIWPELPIVIYARDMEFRRDVTNIISAVRHNNRVCEIHHCDGYWKYQYSLLDELAAIEKPFPALTTLQLSTYGESPPVIPDSFLGGSAPRLRSISLHGIPYPSIGKLLSSTTTLVRLSLRHIPHSGYIAPETIVPCLATLVRLESLDLGFRHHRSGDNRASRHPPPLTRVVVPKLTSFNFHGDIEYLEDILSQIETPMLIQSYFYVFTQLVFDTPLLVDFIRRTERFKTSHAAHVKRYNSSICIRLLKQEDMPVGVGFRSQGLSIRVSCNPLDRQLSALVQLLTSFLPSLSTLESLRISDRCEPQGEITAVQWRLWRELLHLFTTVKKVTLESDAVLLIAPALREPGGEGVTKVLLPALRDLFLNTRDWRPSGPVKEAIEEFIASRQIYCLPAVTVHYYS
jgi:hypothetical protein